MSKRQHKEEQSLFTNRNQTHTQNTHTHNLFLNWYVKESRRDPFIGENEQFFFKLFASQTGETSMHQCMSPLRLARQGATCQSNWRVQLVRNHRWYWRFSLHVLLHAQIAIAAGVFFESSRQKQTHPGNCLERAPFRELLCKRTPSREICPLEKDLLQDQCCLHDMIDVSQLEAV